jgi:hypothetical protein
VNPLFVRFPVESVLCGELPVEIQIIADRLDDITAIDVASHVEGLGLPGGAPPAVRV